MPYKDYTWEELIKLRDGLEIVKDIMRDQSREWEVIDEELSWVSEEIDRRYKERSKVC